MNLPTWFHEIRFSLFSVVSSVFSVWTKHEHKLICFTCWLSNMIPLAAQCSTVFQYRLQKVHCPISCPLFLRPFIIIIIMIIHLFSIGFNSSILICITIVCLLRKRFFWYNKLVFAALLPLSILYANIFRISLSIYKWKRSQFTNVLILSFRVNDLIGNDGGKKPLKLKEPIARQTILPLLIP